MAEQKLLEGNHVGDGQAAWGRVSVALFDLWRLRADLQDASVVVSRKTVAKLMRGQGIAGISPRTWHPATTVHGDDPFPVPDPIERQLDQGERDVAWFSNTTYLRTGEGWAYLCVVVRDGHTRRVLSTHVADRGTQYTGGQLADAAADLGVLRSIGHTGVCWDNAAAESFQSIIKNEYHHQHTFATIEAARHGSYAWIDGWHNARRHSRIGYLSPLEYERRQLALAA